MIAIDIVQSALAAALAGLVPADRIRPFGAWRDLEPPYVLHRPVVRAAPEVYFERVIADVETGHVATVWAADVATAAAIVDRIAREISQHAPPGVLLIPDVGAAAPDVDESGLVALSIDIRVLGGEP